MGPRRPLPQRERVLTDLRIDAFSHVRVAKGWPADTGAVRARALAFWGPGRLLFGTDVPFDDEDGAAYVRDTIANVEALDAGDADRQRIFAGNARAVLRID